MQIPAVPGRLHDRQLPVHVVAQHTPCAQMPFAHSSALLQSAPTGFFPHEPMRHTPGAAQSLSTAQKEFYERAGFYITGASYILRPEVMESFYYAYRVTGDPQYRDWVWDAFVAINATCRTPTGFAGISNVNVEGGGEKQDNQESFLFAEVMKYAYLGVSAGEHS